jgi:hypothetical protein
MTLADAVLRGHGRPRAIARSWLPIFALLACGSSTTTGDGAGKSVCPACPELAGGESSDFGGTPNPCVQFEEHSPIDAARASELGFDVPRLQALVAREVDAPLHWRQNDAPLYGGAASGYEPETRIVANVVITGYRHVALDEAACDGNECLVADGEQPLVCSDRLELDVRAMIHSADGAVAATTNGYILQGRAGFPFAEVPGGSMFANLRDVRGTLEVAPDERTEIVRAVLSVDLRLGPERTEGDLRPHLLLQVGDVQFADYLPLFGSWPDALESPTNDGDGRPDEAADDETAE